MVKFNKQDYEKWTTFRMGKKQYLSRAEFEMVCYFHSKYHKHSYYLPCTCSPKTIKQWIVDLNKIWENGDS
tara:strand:+ start:106 stop:318 length:213 start_codon:yes stop_codon:yes gene_type:complete